MTAAIDRTFGQDWNVTNSATRTTAAYTPTDPSASYPNAVDMYSVNYLNWKYGAKGATGAPIGRKRRLQIGKDALTDLVNKTNGIRFGLMVYNKLSNDITIRNTQGSQGGNIVYPIRRMGSSETDSDYVNRASISRAINSVVATGTTPLTEVDVRSLPVLSRGVPRIAAWRKGGNPARTIVRISRVRGVRNAEGGRLEYVDPPPGCKTKVQ